MRRQRFVVGALVAALILAPAAGSWAGINLVTNGSFEQNGGVGQIAGGVSYATGWTTGTPSDATYAFNFIVDANADSSGFPSVFTPQAQTNIYLWGPNTPANKGGSVANGFQGSPDGGSFLGMDGGYATAPVSQVISGLTVGTQYTLSFQWAASQFTDANLPTTQSLGITFGTETASTPQFNLPGKGFSGWMNFSTDFTASSVQQTLSFLAQAGGPSALPPFTLLDGVTLIEKTNNVVPEPSSILMLTAGLLCVGVYRRRHLRAQAA